MSVIGEGRTSGFTLLEALVVIAITALLSGLMFPRLQGAIAGQEFRTARSQMIMGVRTARANAIRSGGPVAFALEQSGGAYRIGSNEAVKLPAAVGLARQAGGTAKRGDALTFFPDGTSNGGKIVLTGKGVRETFIIFPTTGLIVEERQ